MRHGWCKTSTCAVQPPKDIGKIQRDYDAGMSKQRHLAGNCSAKIKEFNGRATRHDKTD